VQITAGTFTARVGETVSFDVHTVNDTRRVTSAHWNFNDGTTADAISPSHAWSAPGTYQLSAAASIDDGSTVTAFAQMGITGPANVTVRVTVSGPGAGESVSFGSAVCPPTCAQDFPEGTSVRFIANNGNNGNGSVFGNWDGACFDQGSAPFCDLVVSSGPSAANVTAVFLPRVLLQLVTFSNDPTAPPGSGGTLFVNDGNNCGDCSFAYPVNTTVTVTPQPAPGFQFFGWQADCAAAVGNTCTLTLDGNKTAQAFFVPGFAAQTPAVAPAGGPQAVGSRPVARRRRRRVS
jgi:hypothetical protein